MWIKICGTTSLEDALLAVDAGADAVGFVFATSPRRMTAGQVAEITPELPAHLGKIGVFCTQDFDEIAFALRTAGLNGVQLHGELDFRLTEKLRDAFDSEFFLMQTLHWNLNSGPARAEEKLRNELRAVLRHSGIDAVLLDTRTTNANGGTGQTFDWARARQVLGDEAGDLRIIAAGGLHPYNVADAIRTLSPWGVDVASGVELHAGRKDPMQVRMFIQAARATFSEGEKPTPRTPAVSPP